MLVIIREVGEKQEGFERYSVMVDGAELFQFNSCENAGFIDLMKTVHSEAKTAKAKELGLRLKQLRENADMTLKEVADLTGKSIAFISDLEHGRKTWAKTAWNIYAKVQEVINAESKPEVLPE